MGGQHRAGHPHRQGPGRQAGPQGALAAGQGDEDGVGQGATAAHDDDGLRFHRRHPGGRAGRQRRGRLGQQDRVAQRGGQGRPGEGIGEGQAAGHVDRRRAGRRRRPGGPPVRPSRNGRRRPRRVGRRPGDRAQGRGDRRPTRRAMPPTITMWVGFSTLTSASRTEAGMASGCTYSTGARSSAASGRGRDGIGEVQAADHDDRVDRRRGRPFRPGRRRWRTGRRPGARVTWPVVGVVNVLSWLKTPAETAPVLPRTTIRLGGQAGQLAR